MTGRYRLVAVAEAPLGAVSGAAELSPFEVCHSRTIDPWLTTRGLWLSDRAHPLRWSASPCSLCVGLLVHLCIAVKPADKPAARPRRARTSFSAVANCDGTVLEVTAAIHGGKDQEGRTTCSFPIEDWTSEELATKKCWGELKRKMAKELEGQEMAAAKRQETNCEAKRRALRRIVEKHFHEFMIHNMIHNMY